MNYDFDKNEVWRIASVFLAALLAVALIALMSTEAPAQGVPVADGLSCVRYVDGIYFLCRDVWNDPTLPKEILNV